MHDCETDRSIGAGCCFAADEGLLKFAVEEFAYFGNQFKCRRSHVSPRRMDADGPVVCRARRGGRLIENLSQVEVERKARGSSKCMPETVRISHAMAQRRKEIIRLQIFGPGALD